MLTIDRGLAFAGAGVLAAINAQATQILDALRYLPLADVFSNLAGISAVIWFALYVALRIGLEPGAAAFRPLDAPVLGATLLLSFLPISYAAQAGLLLCGLYLVATAPLSDRAGRLGLLLLALTGPLLWGRIVLHAFITPLLDIDAFLVGSAIGSAVEGNVVHFANGSGMFLIAGQCSSVHNMSLAILLWSSAAVLFKLRIDARLCLFGLAMVALMFALNIARLALIGLFPDSFHYLHDGMGAELFGWAGLVGVAAVAGYGVIDAVDRQ